MSGSLSLVMALPAAACLRGEPRREVDELLLHIDADHARRPVITNERDIGSVGSASTSTTLPPPMSAPDQGQADRMRRRSGMTPDACL
jgi:hypothetical protein